MPAGSAAALADAPTRVRPRASEPRRVTVAGRPATRQLRALTRLRFVGCFAVFLHHCVDFTPELGHAHGLGRLLWEGWSGVSFFFVLSGFILAYSYGERLHALRPGAKRSFYVAR